MKQSAPCCLRDIFKIENLKKKNKTKKPKNNFKHYTKNTIHVMIKEEA